MIKAITLILFLSAYITTVGAGMNVTMFALGVPVSLWVTILISLFLHIALLALLSDK